MTDQLLQITIGGLLHDVGKVIYRSSDHRTHSESGYAFLKEETNIEDAEIWNQVRYHHGKALSQAKIPDDSFAYITYIADNIAAAMDRREKEENTPGFVKNAPLESIFNILNNNHEKKVYKPGMLDVEGIINFPTNKKISYEEGFYAGIVEKIRSCLTDFQWNDGYINALLEVLEATLTFIPSSTSKAELADISLFDHVKMTAALGCCIYSYLNDQGTVDYKQELYRDAKKFYDKKAFLIYSLDISGIQDFIYTISSKGALKGLRSRSFYLEIMMEHIIDQLLDKLSLSRVNLIYSGGGHAYMILPNTEKVKSVLQQNENELNQWFLDHFETSLYIAGGEAECSANNLSNIPERSYREVFQEVSRKISTKKMRRYTPQQIISLNQTGYPNGERECPICHRHDRLREDGKCEICWSLEKMSNEVLHGKFYTVLGRKEDVALPLPGNCYLIAENQNSLKNRMKNDDYYIRAYGKNAPYSGYYVATKLWVGDYVCGETFEELAKAASGIERIAVMRADVDNLGQAFVRGFESEKTGSKYVTLSRTATFSRKLSMFFKYHINQILEESNYAITLEGNEQRNALIVYSGGDDVFIIGAWDDVIGFAIDLYDNLREYSQETLTISAGIGLYPAKYPISIMAKETGELEDASKRMEGKNAVTLFNEDYTFHWDEFIEDVVEEKLALLQDFFQTFDEKGKNFLYNLLNLIRSRHEEAINIARYAYFLGRMAPEVKNINDPKEVQRKEEYNQFSKQMYQWIRNDKDAKQLEMAIYLYVYMNRTKEEMANEAE